MGDEVTVEDFVPFMGTDEANFLGGEASVKGVKGFDPEAVQKEYAKPNSGIGFLGALELINRVCLKVAVASSADRIKVDANLAAAGLPISIVTMIKVVAFTFTQTQTTRTISKIYLSNIWVVGINLYGQGLLYCYPLVVRFDAIVSAYAFENLKCAPNYIYMDFY
ncbi:hypothetical protein Pint_07037 [Pistacia integerrima]|uniref:Uncharacterized protein n=1 Tax=Pistacia integerrima TaxID=434235 RepID=A0ACC0XV28_9ROSI|nr:hypothetical protein Pint_07037 [Pistacia integerrima]